LYFIIFSGFLEVAKFQKEFRPHSFPRPLSAGGIQIRIPPKKSAEVKRKILSPEKRFSLCRVRIEAPPHCPNTWRAEPQKEKCPFHFRKIPPRENQKARDIFLFGVAERSEAVAGLSWSVRFNLEPPRAPRVRHHLFWK